MSNLFQPFAPGSKWWTSFSIDSRDTLVNQIIGPRGNGKTTFINMKMLCLYWYLGEKGVVIRKQENEIVKSRSDNQWSEIISHGWIEQVTHGKYSTIRYKGRGFYLSNYDEENNKHQDHHTLFSHMLALTQAGLNKSLSFPEVYTIAFDEYLIRDGSYIGEFDDYESTVSTIVRHRARAKVYLLGNVVASRSEYFREYGITGVAKMPVGSITTYQLVDPETQELFNGVSLEKCHAVESGRASNRYFAKPNRGAISWMITGENQMANYPKQHNLGDYRKSDAKIEMYFISYDVYLKGVLFKTQDKTFILVRSLDEVERININDIITDRDIVYTSDPNPKKRYYMDPMRNYGNRVTRVIAKLFNQERVFFDSNETGEAMTDFLRTARRYSLLNMD